MLTVHCDGKTGSPAGWNNFQRGRDSLLDSLEKTDDIIAKFSVKLYAFQAELAVFQAKSFKQVDRLDRSPLVRFYSYLVD